MTANSNRLHVLGISGSLRQGSYNSALLRTATELMPPGMTLEIFDLAPLPIFNADYEKPFPDVVVEFRTRLAQANALLIATPGVQQFDQRRPEERPRLGLAFAPAAFERQAGCHDWRQHWQLWHAESPIASAPDFDPCGRITARQA